MGVRWAGIMNGTIRKLIHATESGFKKTAVLEMKLTDTESGAGRKLKSVLGFPVFASFGIALTQRCRNLGIRCTNKNKDLKSVNGF